MFANNRTGKLITRIFLEMTKDLSLRALVDFGASNNFVRRQSLEHSRLKFVERVTPPTRLTVRLATGASIAEMKRVVISEYTFLSGYRRACGKAHRHPRRRSNALNELETTTL